MSTGKGFLFAVNGPGFLEMAVEAARSVRKHCPGVPIDLVADRSPEDDVFDEVRLLEGPVRYPKIPALRTTRFARTVFLDADIRILADISDIFEVLERFDLAAAHDQLRNSSGANVVWRQSLPNAFPQVNAGVLGYRRTDEVMALIDLWESGFHDLNIGKDQPVLRELLWETDLRVAILPSEYNLRDLARIQALTTVSTAPRVLHSYLFAKELDLDRLLERWLGGWQAAHLAMLLRADQTLAARVGREVQPPNEAERAWIRRERRKRNVSLYLKGLTRQVIRAPRRALRKMGASPKTPASSNDQTRRG